MPDVWIYNQKFYSMNLDESLKEVHLYQIWYRLYHVCVTHSNVNTGPTILGLDKNKPEVYPKASNVCCNFTKKSYFHNYWSWLFNAWHLSFLFQFSIIFYVQAVVPCFYSEYRLFVSLFGNSYCISGSLNAFNLVNILSSCCIICFKLLRFFLAQSFCQITHLVTKFPTLAGKILEAVCRSTHGCE